MNDFNVEIICNNKKCNSKNVVVTAIDKYEGDIILLFTCNECGNTETWGVLDEINN